MPQIYIFGFIHHTIQVQALFYQRRLTVLHTGMDVQTSTDQISGGGVWAPNPHGCACSIQVNHLENLWKECPFSKQCIKFQAREWKTSKIDNLKIKASSLYIKAGIHTFKCLSGYNFIVLQGNRTLCRQTNSGQSRCGLVNLRISQLAKTSDLKFAINNHYKFDLQ